MRWGSAAALSIAGWRSMGSSPRGRLNPGARSGPRKRPRLRYERRVGAFHLPGCIAWAAGQRHPHLASVLDDLESKLASSRAELFFGWLLAAALREQTTRPLQTLANVLSALREEDYSFRARGAAFNDALGELSLEVNALADELADQRIGSIEATALLRRVVEEVEVPLFAFDPRRDSAFSKPSRGTICCKSPSVRVLGSTADELGLKAVLPLRMELCLPLNLNSPSARWLIRRSTFRQRGIPAYARCSL